MDLADTEEGKKKSVSNFSPVLKLFFPDLAAVMEVLVDTGAVTEVLADTEVVMEVLADTAAGIN